jgi:aspartyl-tRNA(Asn)/glutamyl-tRNA(Gln) amidotransferase subunit A
MNITDILPNASIETIRTHLKNGDFSLRELVDTYKKIINEKNGELHAFLEIFDAPDDISFDESKPLSGVVIAMKDNILISGHKASASSKMLENHTATYDATITKKLRDAGAIFIGRTNMDEFAMGSSTENSAFGRTKNPLDPNRVPGGSSGGSAAAVAMDGALIGMGTDTGGSIRQPASFCGLVGLYPTYGSVSRYGLIAMGSSLDQAGPMTKNVADAEIIFNIIKGYDTYDATTLTDDQYQQLQKPFKKKIGVPYHLLEMPGVDQEVRDNFAESLEHLQSQGYELIDISLPHAHLGLGVYYIIMPAEVSSNLARYDGIRYGHHQDGKNLLEVYTNSKTSGFGPETKRRILLGTYVLSSGYYDAYYSQSQKVRALIDADYMKAFESVTAIVTPTTPSVAFISGAKKDPLSMYMADMFTVSANLAGVPALSVPSGHNSEGMPFGIQFIASHGNENHLFSIGKDFEKRK